MSTTADPHSNIQAEPPAPAAQTNPASAEAPKPPEFVNNDDISRAFYYGKMFKPEELERICQAPTDPQLTQNFWQHQHSLMPGFQHFMQAQPQLLALSPENAWLHEHLHQLLRVLNDKHYHFEVSRTIGTQLLTLETGQQVDWHSDLGEGFFAFRKLSLVVFLTPKEDYKGGKLELMSSSGNSLPPDKGVLLVYPSFGVSRITPVTQGRLQVLLTWIHGQQCYQ